MLPWGYVVRPRRLDDFIPRSRVSNFRVDRISTFLRV